MLREDRTVWLDAPLIPARPASVIRPPPSTRGPGGLGVAWHAAQPHVLSEQPCARMQPCALTQPCALMQPRARMQSCGGMPARRPHAAHDTQSMREGAGRNGWRHALSLSPSGAGRWRPGRLRQPVFFPVKESTSTLYGSIDRHAHAGELLPRNGQNGRIMLLQLGPGRGPSLATLPYAPLLCQTKQKQTCCGNGRRIREIATRARQT